MKNCNLEVYMHPKLCMDEHFDLITNQFKYTCETSQVFIHPFQKIVASAKFNIWIMVSISSKWMIWFM
jgi:hypothetical protein